MPTKAELQGLVDDLKDQLVAIVDVLQDPAIEDEDDRVDEALALADFEVLDDDDEDEDDEY